MLDTRYIKFFDATDVLLLELKPAHATYGKAVVQKWDKDEEKIFDYEDLTNEENGAKLKQFRGGYFNFKVPVFFGEAYADALDAIEPDVAKISIGVSDEKHEVSVSFEEEDSFPGADLSMKYSLIIEFRNIMYSDPRFPAIGYGVSYGESYGYL